MKAKSKIKKQFLLVTLVAAAAVSSSQAAPVYLNTNFDQSDITGPLELPSTSNFTGMIGAGGGNVTIEENFTTAAVGDPEPTGQHLRIDGNNSKSATMENAMTLTTDGLSSFTVDFSYMLSNGLTFNRGRVLYSHLGTFGAETVELRNYVLTGDGTLIVASDPLQTVVDNQVWNQESFTVTSSDVTFSDTAKIRFAQDTGGSTSSAFYLDDIVISAVPEPSAAALIGLAGLALLIRRRR